MFATPYKVCVGIELLMPHTFLIDAHDEIVSNADFPDFGSSMTILRGAGGFPAVVMVQVGPFALC